MVNMNRYKEPAIYALVAPDGALFYVGRTSVNAQNRLWEHIHRARSGHGAPVYRRMREVGLDVVQYEVLQHLRDGDDARALEAEWIICLLKAGHPLVNEMGRDGVPDSWSEQLKQTAFPERRGKSTWITGKTGEAAGWTEARRQAQSERRRQARVPQHGSETERRKYGCDCEECLDWESGHRAAIEAKKTKNQHGTVASYKHGGCRCQECGAAYREYQKRFRKA